MINIQPPLSVNQEMTDYLNRLQENINTAMLSINGTSAVTDFPEKPRKGKIYWLQNDSQTYTAGYYVYENDEWQKLNLTLPENLGRTWNNI